MYIGFIRIHDRVTPTIYTALTTSSISIIYYCYLLFLCNRSVNLVTLQTRNQPNTHSAITFFFAKLCLHLLLLCKSGQSYSSDAISFNNWRWSQCISVHNVYYRLCEVSEEIRSVTNNRKSREIKIFSRIEVKRE